MKIVCDVEVSNRLLPSQNMAGSRRAVKSTLGIGKLNPQSENIFLIHQTNQNKTGNKYKVSGNIEALFTRFLSEGKATIRFRNPPHDLCVRSAAPIALNVFLRILRYAGEKSEKAVLSISEGNLKENKSAPGEVSKSKPQLGIISPASRLLSSVKRSMKITRPSEYSSIAGFPKTLEELQIVQLQISSLDRRVTRLPLLRTLDLTDNRLTNLPKELNLLCNLRELRLPHNSFGESNDKEVSSSSGHLSLTDNERWAWIGGNLAKSLVYLDLSYNKLKHAPDALCRLKSLLNLKLDNNNLSELPSGLGTMSNLRLLSISKNSLLYLPGSLTKLHLEALDLSKNPPMEAPVETPRQLWPDSLSPSVVLGVPMLLECAARQVVAMGLQPTASDVPRTIVSYLTGANYCICGKPCFKSKLKMLVRCNPRNITWSVTMSCGAPDPPMLAYLCSLHCLETLTTKVSL